MWRRYIVYGLMALLIVACTPARIDRALHVVAQADSLWLSGSAYEDSASLAQAYMDLGSQSGSYPDAYVHACYHYGRLLRTKDDPVGAMQAFINATHAGSHDFHILGRVYSNMGDIAHLADEFPLAYSLYDKSGKMYLQNGDTLLYYYDLNNMAFELAEQGKKDSTLNLLSKITNECSNKDVLAKTLETKALLYFQIEQYESVISAVNILQTHKKAQSTSYVLKARAYWHIEEYDSALYYAKYVLESPLAIEQEKYNMFYILMNHDSTLSIEEKMAMSAQRSDIETDVLIPLHNGVAVAVQLLKQDLVRKTEWTWLYAVLITLAVIGISSLIYIQSKRRKKGLLTQKIDVLEQAASNMQEKHNELTQRLVANHRRIEEEINSRCTMLQTNDKITKILAWKNYDKMCTVVDKQFYMMASKLKNKHLSEIAIRVCVLTLLECSYDQMAELLYYSPSGIGKLKIRVAGKLGTTSKELRKYLIDNVCIG